MDGRSIGGFLANKEYMRKPSFGVLRKEIGFSGLSPRGYVSVAEAVSSTDVEEDVSMVEEIKELLNEMRKEQKKEVKMKNRRCREIERGMGNTKYQMLKRRQVKIETEAWEQAAKEYKELLMDMCEHKLAPNLPYMKSLFLGWFEPLRDAIIKEQELYRLGELRANYAAHLDQLPAEMTAVITMHKLVGLLMSGEHGYTRVVQAACVIGDAIEQEVDDLKAIVSCVTELSGIMFQGMLR
ncbi:DNA-directed RNA polymerase 2, chloroplastic/mitochondrial [Corchorus olitorius]|uniref:DNA-directed RNA polymerase 2, chloroplastic/mitochondrial n=1 Tax=Corchorus olitorius TaxID=93759 RepID=A0A1R3HZN3_9ROSI|nr:DNA-directed RNA polymerase 2, chloroplastic/mitochondrial [Corchorus olitorius]